MFFANQGNHVFVDMQEQRSVADKAGGGLKRFSVDLNQSPVGVQELPEFKMTIHEFQYVIPARKIIVMPPQSWDQGIFVQAAVDPNGTGNYEVVLIINWPDWPQKGKRIRLLEDKLPSSLKPIDSDEGWNNPNGGISWIGKFVFHNGTRKPFVLDPSCFADLPATADWPVIEIPPAG